MALVRGDDLSVVELNSRADDHHVRASDILRAMLAANNRSHFSQARCHRRGLAIGSGNLVSEIEQHLGNSAHADAANAHEMNALNFRKHGKDVFLNDRVEPTFSACPELVEGSV